MIQLKRISKRFGKRLAVDDLTLEVPAGEVYGLLGHNGAGKSTAIGMMLGQVWPTSGEVRVCGHDVTRNRRQALQRVGALFESPAFYDYLSGRRNLEILASYTGPTPRRRIDEVIEWVGLKGREGSKVRTYSHGMRARLAIAQALLPEPNLLILDEPSDGLDPEGIHEVRHTIRRLHSDLGMTILLSSHFLNEVEQICTRIAVLSQGKKVFEGKMGEAKQHADRVRIKVQDFPRAAMSLKGAGLIGEDLGGMWIVPAAGVGTDRIVKHLVEIGEPVYEIVREERTLEDFYLELMNGKEPAKPPVVELTGGGSPPAGKAI